MFSYRFLEIKNRELNLGYLRFEVLVYLCEQITNKSSRLLMSVSTFIPIRI